MLAFEAGVAADVSFKALSVSPATAATVHFGDMAAPSSGEKLPANLQAAGHAIDVLAVLEEKARGNLTEEEKIFLTEVLYEFPAHHIEPKKVSES